MDDPKKNENSPVSPVPEEPTDPEAHSETPVNEKDGQGSPEDAPGEAVKPDNEGDKAGKRQEEDSDEKPAGGEDESDSSGDAPEKLNSGDQEEPGKPEEDSPDSYEDPYDPDGIYSGYDDFAEDDEYAPKAERMPERPDDPHYQEPDEEEDRAGEEARQGRDNSENEKKSGETETGKSVKPAKKEVKEEEEEDDDDGFFDERERELGGRMSFLDHLDELRKRIFHALISVIITFVAAWVFREQIFGFLSAPIKEVVDQLVVLRPTEPFTVYLKVSFMAAIFFAIPYIMLQVWLFIAPGLYRKEKVYALPFLFSSSILFVLGGMFAYYIILPPALNFLLNDFGSEFQAVISAIEYYDFELIIIVGMGAIFQLPVVVAFLSMFGMVTPGFLWRNFKYAFLLITIIAAVVSPTTDPMNLFLWSGPMVILYTFSIGISWIFMKRRSRRQKREG